VKASRRSITTLLTLRSLQNIPRSISGTSSTDIRMGDASPRPRTFASKALEQEHIDYLVQLDTSLAENPLDYYTHVSFVTTLHQGLQYHVSTIDPGNARTYELLPILRDAYQNMAKKYPLGEVLWEYRLSNEMALATNVEDRMTVIELFKHATLEEPHSAKIWVSYGEYVDHLIACSWEQNPPEQWSEDDKAVGRELFTPQLLLDIWQQGADKVKYNLQDSSMVWDRYLQFLRDDLERSGLAQDKVAKVTAVFNERLGQPHATWTDTLSKYASFVSRLNGNTEEAMENAIQQNTHIKQQYTNREEFEFKLLQAVQQGDQTAEYHAMTRYLKWEKKTMGVYSFHLVNALYERATLRFPANSTLWEDHVEFLIWQNNRSVDLLNVLERATTHCAWSGALWSHRILTLEAEQKGFDEIEGVKHTATGTGLLEHTDLDELIKVQIAWCGYLRRRAFEAHASEDDADIAEVGIRSALEHVREVGMKKYGRDWPGDSKYRLERIHIKFWLQRGNIEEARSIWNFLVKTQEDSYDFWYRYYIWEMVLWSNHAVRDKKNEGQHLLPPTGATAVLERGMQRLKTIDQPEPLIEMYANHCEQHETVLKVRSALIDRRRSERIVTMRRQTEAAAAAARQPEPAPNHVVDGSSKRKRDDAHEESPAKKAKQLQVDDASSAFPASASGEPRGTSEVPSDAGSASLQKRDREHTTIIVQRLPQNTTQTQIRKFFTDAGKVRNVTMKPEKDSMVAIVEFETPDEADYALTKEAKGFEGNEITIKRGGNTAVYVANYPAAADEAYVRKLFEPFGEVLGIRFPSLKFDTHRRFCYVQFANSNDAIAATKLDGTDQDGFKIIAKISNPEAKKKRDGATAEGRELYIWHLNFKCKKSEIQEAFEPFGKIERVNIPTRVGGNNKGFAYIVYETKEQAEAAVAEMNGKDFAGFELHVEIATDKDAKPKIKSTIENTTSSVQREATPGQADTSMDTDAATGSKGERTIAFLNLPDTVNDARLKTLLEPYTYKKITLMPQHGGALIEFGTVEQAGKAEFALQGKDFEGRKLRIGRGYELMKQKGEWKASNSFIQPTRVNRPTPRGGARGGLRGRGKPGLGHRPSAPRKEAPASNGEKAKSNDEFRAMLLRKKGSDDGEKSTEDKMES
jgi:RNA recognition motif-containing protein